MTVVRRRSVDVPRPLYCLECGAKNLEYDLRLNMRYVRLWIAVFEPAGVGRVVQPRELGLYDDLDRVTISYGKHFGVIEKCYAADGSELRGSWKLTQLGADFLAGKARLPVMVTTFRNKVVRSSRRKVRVQDTPAWEAVTYESVLRDSRVNTTRQNVKEALR